MSRETSYARMLDASAKVQWNIAMILEAKAVEAEKVRAWLCNHVTADAFVDEQGRFKSSLNVHEQLVEVIYGLARLNQGMTSVLKAALNHVDDMSMGNGNGNGMGGMMGGGTFDLGEKFE